MGEPLPEETQVLIVGAGPTGLSAALCFAELGVDAVLVEARLSPHNAPSAHVINRRSLEVFRSVGAFDQVACGKGVGCPKELLWVSKVAERQFGSWGPPEAGIEIGAAMQNVPPGGPSRKNVGVPRMSPVGEQLNLSQPQLEEILADVLRQRHAPRAHARYGCLVEGVEQEDDCVTATVVQGGGAGGGEGRRCRVRCKYLIACDGARSPIRESLGILMESSVPLINPAAYDPKGGVIQTHVWIYFKADLTHLFNAPYGPALWWYHADTASGLIINYNGKDEWVVHAPFFPDEESPPHEWTEAECVRRVSDALGETPRDLAIKAKGQWQMTCNVATSYQVGRVFLAGDSCHRFPPSGGHGQNTGIQDVQNLSWKINAVLKGWASPALLDSYEEERWPVGRFNADQSARNNKQMAEIEGAIGMQPASPWKTLAEYRRSLEHLKTAKCNEKSLQQALQRSSPHWFSEGQQIGFTYEEGALVPDGTPCAQEALFPRQTEIHDGSVLIYEPTTRPGSRLPHLWVAVLRGEGLRRRGAADMEVPAHPLGPGPDAFPLGAVCAALHDCMALDAISLLTVDSGVDWDAVVPEVRRTCSVPLVHVHLLADGVGAATPKTADMLLAPAPQPVGEAPAREMLELLEPGACLLVRPDETVGFRAASGSALGGAGAAAALAGALRQIARTGADGQGLPALANPCRRGGDWPKPKLKGRILDTTPIIPPHRFAHAVLRTQDIDRAIAWYGRVLGAHVVQRSEFLAFLTYDEEHHRVALVATPQRAPAPPGAAGLDHLAYTHKDLGTLLATYARLKKEGIEPFWTVNHGPTTSMYYRDPDGNGVELQVDNFPTEEELKAWMKSDHFADNQIGVEFDADRLLELYTRGDPVEALQKQGVAGSSARPKF